VAARAGYTRARYRARRKSAHAAAVEEPEIAAARESLEAFGLYVCGREAAALHRSWFPLLVPGGSNDALNRIAGPDTNLLSFRGSGKSTWSRIWAAWLIGHNPGIQIGWVSYSEAIALKSSRVIKRIIDSPRYREVFPTIRKGSRWGDVDWEIDKGFAGASTLDSDITLQSLGATGSVTSNRFHLLVFDDLIKSSAAISNPEVRETMLSNIQDAIEPCLVPGGRQIDLGTRWNAEDIHATYFNRENNWQVIEQPAIITTPENSEASAWPERFSLEFLQDIRARKPISFLYQYQNQIPENDDDLPIKPSFIRYGEPPSQFDQIVLAMDLAAGEEAKDDYTAIVIAGKAGQTYWVLHAEEFRASGNLAKIRRVQELRKKWRFNRLLVEKNAYQKSFEGDWRDHCKRCKVQDVVCETVAATKDKLMRLQDVSGVFENGFVMFNKNQPLSRLIAQLLLADQAHDDLLDSCVYALGRLLRRSRKSISSV
jgi:predicted phage terminase large subunit-like protein